MKGREKTPRNAEGQKDQRITAYERVPMLNPWARLAKGSAERSRRLGKNTNKRKGSCCSATSHTAQAAEERGDIGGMAVIKASHNNNGDFFLRKILGGSSRSSPSVFEPACAPGEGLAKDA